MEAWRAWRTRLPLEVAVLLVFDLVAGTFGVLAWAFPLSRFAPVQLDLAMGLLAWLLALVNWRVAWALPVRAIHAELLVGSGGLAAIVASCHTAVGAGLPAVGLLCLVLYAGAFLPLGAALAHAGVALLALGIAYSASVVRVETRAWGAIVVALAIAAVVFGHVVRKLRVQASTDPLTGLLNRSAIRALADRELARVRRDGGSATLVVFDIDGLKAVNDTGGHLAGDRLLRQFAADIRALLRAGDVAARYGGDEFLVLLTGTDASAAELVIERLRARDSCWSAGIAEWSEGEDYESWFARADAALYREKAAR